MENSNDGLTFLHGYEYFLSIRHCFVQVKWPPYVELCVASILLLESIERWLYQESPTALQTKFRRIHVSTISMTLSPLDAVRDRGDMLCWPQRSVRVATIVLFQLFRLLHCGLRSQSDVCAN